MYAPGVPALGRDRPKPTLVGVGISPNSDDPNKPLAAYIASAMPKKPSENPERMALPCVECQHVTYRRPDCEDVILHDWNCDGPCAVFERFPLLEPHFVVFSLGLPFNPAGYVVKEDEPLLEYFWVEQQCLLCNNETWQWATQVSEIEDRKHGNIAIKFPEGCRDERCNQLNGSGVFHEGQCFRRLLVLGKYSDHVGEHHQLLQSQQRQDVESSPWHAVLGLPELGSFDASRKKKTNDKRDQELQSLTESFAQLRAERKQTKLKEERDDERGLAIATMEKIRDEIASRQLLIENLESRLAQAEQDVDTWQSTIPALKGKMAEDSRSETETRKRHVRFLRRLLSTMKKGMPPSREVNAEMESLSASGSSRFMDDQQRGTTAHPPRQERTYAGGRRSLHPSSSDSTLGTGKTSKLSSESRKTAPRTFLEQVQDMCDEYYERRFNLNEERYGQQRCLGRWTYNSQTKMTIRRPAMPPPGNRLVIPLCAACDQLGHTEHEPGACILHPNNARRAAIFRMEDEILRRNLPLDHGMYDTLVGTTRHVKMWQCGRCGDLGHEQSDEFCLLHPRNWYRIENWGHSRMSPRHGKSGRRASGRSLLAGRRANIPRRLLHDGTGVARPGGRTNKPVPLLRGDKPSVLLEKCRDCRKIGHTSKVDRKCPEHKTLSRISVDGEGGRPIYGALAPYDPYNPDDTDPSHFPSLVDDAISSLQRSRSSSDRHSSADIRPSKSKPTGRMPPHSRTNAHAAASTTAQIRLKKRHEEDIKKPRLTIREENLKKLDDEWDYLAWLISHEKFEKKKEWYRGRQRRVASAVLISRGGTKYAVEPKYDIEFGLDEEKPDPASSIARQFPVLVRNHARCSYRLHKTGTKEEWRHGPRTGVPSPRPRTGPVRAADEPLRSDTSSGNTGKEHRQMMPMPWTNVRDAVARHKVAQESSDTGTGTDSDNSLVQQMRPWDVLRFANPRGQVSTPLSGPTTHRQASRRGARKAATGRKTSSRSSVTSAKLDMGLGMPSGLEEFMERASQNPSFSVQKLSKHSRPGEAIDPLTTLLSTIQESEENSWDDENWEDQNKDGEEDEGEYEDEDRDEDEDRHEDDGADEDDDEEAKTDEGEQNEEEGDKGEKATEEKDEEEGGDQGEAKKDEVGAEQVDEVKLRREKVEGKDKGGNQGETGERHVPEGPVPSSG